MEFYELINERSSIRVFKNTPVPLEAVERIITAAGRASSWANKQCWRFIVVDSKVEKNLIGKASGQANISKACENAPLVVVLCAIPGDSGSKNGISYYMFDSALAMENLVLASKHEGLSTCIVGYFDEKALRGILNIPEDIKVVAFTPLGYADETVSPRPRKKTGEIMYHNRWGTGF